MKPRIKVLTLAVSDLNRSLAFYREGLGLSTKGIIGQEFEDGAVVFFNMNDDLILTLYQQPRCPTTRRSARRETGSVPSLSVTSSTRKRRSMRS